MRLRIDKGFMKGAYLDIQNRKGIDLIYKDRVNRLLGGLVHDFNNLLMCIQGNSSLILFEMDEDNPHFKRLKQIEDYVEKGAEITDKILVFIEENKASHNPLNNQK